MSSSIATESGESPFRFEVVPLRRWGRWAEAGIVVVFLGWLLIAAFQARIIDWSVVGEYLTNGQILVGLKNTIVLAVLAQVTGIGLGVVLGFISAGSNPVLKAVARGYTWIFRGAPILVQMLFWFNAVPLIFETISIGIPITGPTFFSGSSATLITPFSAAFLALSLSQGAYMGEIVRGGILAVPDGQIEASKSLGMNFLTMMRLTVLPQATRVVIPATGNQFIGMLKDTSLAYVVGYGELLRRSGDIYTTNLKVMELLLVATFWYLVLTTLASYGQKRLERRAAR